MTNLQEIWKDIPDFEGCYQVSNQGRVKSMPRMVRTRHGFYNYPGKILNPTTRKGNYKIVTLCVNQIDQPRYVHRLVAQAFIQNPENKETVNHINGDKTDNRVENLEWCTPSENTNHALNIGINMSGRLGINKVSVCQYNLNNELIAKHESIKEAARSIDGFATGIRKCFTGVLNTYKGYVWKRHENEVTLSNA